MHCSLEISALRSTLKVEYGLTLPHCGPLMARVLPTEGSNGDGLGSGVLENKHFVGQFHIKFYIFIPICNPQISH